MVFKILKREQALRSALDMHNLNEYFTQQNRTSNQFFRNLLREKGKWDTFRVYKCMELEECQKKGEVIFKYGEIGDKFYVILRGSVGIKVPTEVSSVTPCNNYLDILKFIITHLQSPIIKFRDPHSRICKNFLDVIGSD